MSSCSQFSRCKISCTSPLPCRLSPQVLIYILSFLAASHPLISVLVLPATSLNSHDTPSRRPLRNIIASQFQSKPHILDFVSSTRHRQHQIHTNSFSSRSSAPPEFIMFSNSQSSTNDAEPDPPPSTRAVNVTASTENMSAADKRLAELGCAPVCSSPPCSQRLSSHHTHSSPQTHGMRHTSERTHLIPLTHRSSSVSFQHGLASALP